MSLWLPGCPMGRDPPETDWFGGYRRFTLCCVRFFGHRPGWHHINDIVGFQVPSRPLRTLAGYSSLLRIR
jgi:hypothetical protein